MSCGSNGSGSAVASGHGHVDAGADGSSAGCTVVCSGGPRGGVGCSPSGTAGGSASSSACSSGGPSGSVGCSASGTASGTHKGNPLLWYFIRLECAGAVYRSEFMYM